MTYTLDLVNLSYILSLFSFFSSHEIDDKASSLLPHQRLRFYTPRDWRHSQPLATSTLPYLPFAASPCLIICSKDLSKSVSRLSRSPAVILTLTLPPSRPGTRSSALRRHSLSRSLTINHRHRSSHADRSFPLGPPRGLQRPLHCCPRRPL